MSDIDADSRGGNGNGNGNGLGNGRSRYRPEDFAYVYPPECDRCGTFAHVIEWPHRAFWQCEQCGARGSGFEEPIWWHNDPLSLHYEGETVENDVPHLRSEDTTNTASASARDLWRSTLGTAIVVAVSAAWLAGGLAWLIDASLLAGASLGIVCGLAGVALMQHWRNRPDD